MEPNLPTRQYPVWKLTRADFTFDDDTLVVEEPLELRVNDQPWAATMRTPGQDRDLAIGLAVTEGILMDPSELLDITHCGSEESDGALNICTLYVTDSAAGRVEVDTARSFVNAACGLCGRARIAEIFARCPINSQPFPVSLKLFQSLPAVMRQTQSIFQSTGGLHAAALFDQEGQLLCLREDIGRHNAVDKVIGSVWERNQNLLPGSILIVSGRAGFEIVQKAAMAGITVMGSVSAASGLAVELAEQCGILLVGFMRGETMTVYSGRDRL